MKILSCEFHLVIKSKMKLLLLFFVITTTAHATNCSDRFYFEKYVMLGVCKNYGRGMDEAELYYKGVLKAVNDYIALRVERCELENKPFDIYMLDPILTRPHYELTQNKQSYFIRAGRTLSLDELLKMIDEFTQPRFTAIDVGIWDSENYEKQERTVSAIENILFDKELPETDMVLIKSTEYTIFEKNKLKMTYHNDSVKCFINDKEIAHKLRTWPWVIRDRYIFQEGNMLKIYEDTDLVKTFKNNDVDEWDCESLEVSVFDKWVNFEGYGRMQLSYSYDKNRFYVIKKD